ncbi:MAG: GNAT family N-acetyltransferase [Enterovibrio sp.]
MLKTQQAPQQNHPQKKDAAIDWQFYRFDELTNTQLYTLLKLRCDVFVVEQQCAYPELDQHDCHPQTVHILGMSQDKLAAYARILPAGVKFDEISIGRVVVDAQYRNLQLGHALMHAAIDKAQQIYGKQPITISAQYHLRHFYAKHQFIEISAKYLDDGIEHVNMQRPSLPL